MLSVNMVRWLWREGGFRSQLSPLGVCACETLTLCYCFSCVWDGRNRDGGFGVVVWARTNTLFTHNTQQQSFGFRTPAGGNDDDGIDGRGREFRADR